MTPARIPVAVLGATGTVGQKFVRLLAGHPWFEVAVVAASAQSAGRAYAEAVRWREPTPLPDSAASLVVRNVDERLDVPLAFSALDAVVAGPLERKLAAAGVHVVSNASAHRMDPLVPLLIPEVNAGHLGLLGRQRSEYGWSGGIVANPNCLAAALVLGVAPLHAAFGIDRMVVSSMQAVSGAGYPGVASLDILGNVIPYISGEEEKIERETRKLLGSLTGDRVAEAPIVISAHANRVPSIDGHLAAVSLGLARPATPEQAFAALESWRGNAQVAALPSTPERPIEVDQRPDRPQPRLDSERGAGMSVTVGRVRRCHLLDLRLVVLGHNTVRGAAGAAVQNAELLVATGEVAR